MAEILGAATAATKLFLEVNYVFLFKFVAAWNLNTKKSWLTYMKFKVYQMLTFSQTAVNISKV